MSSGRICESSLAKFVDQGHRPKVKVMRSKKFQWVFQWYVSWRSSMISPMELPKNLLTKITVMNTATWGVSKAYAFFSLGYRS